MPSPLALDIPPAVLTLASAARRQRRYTAMTAAVLAAVAVLAVSLWPRTWRAEATLLVAPQNVPEQYVGSVATTNVQERLGSISKQVLSAPRLEKLIEGQNLYPRHRRFKTREEVLELMRRDIDITLERGWSRSSPGSFRIQYAGQSPQQAAEVTAQIGSFFIEENFRSREDNASGTTEFLTQSIVRSRRQLDSLEEKLAAYKRTHPGALPQQEAGLRTALAAAERSLELAEDSIFRGRQARNETESLLLALEGLVRPPKATTPPPASPAPVSDPEGDRLRGQLALLETRYGPQHPDVTRARQLVAAYQQQASKPAPAAEAPAPTAADWPPPDLAGRLSMLRLRRGQIVEASDRAEKDRLRFAGEARSLREQIAALPVHEQELAILLRDYDNIKSNHRSLLDKKFNAELAADLEHRQKAERFVMLDPPRIPEKARGPSVEFLAAASCLLSILAALALGVMREMRQQRVQGEWELPAGIPLLARLPGGAVAGQSAVRWWELAGPPSLVAIAFALLLMVKTGVL